MPTLPPFTEPTHPNAWHRIISPGGYEAWHFEADDLEHDRHVTVRFWHGCIDHPGYARAYWLYRKFPTRFAPPLPGEFVGVQAVVYEMGRVRYRASIRYPSASFAAATDAPSISIGPNRIDPLADENLRVTLSLDQAGAELVFRPRFVHPVQSQPLGESHRWLVVHPLCDIEGSFDLAGSTLRLSGRGYHDHHFGTRPPACLSQNWIAGRVLDDDSASAFVILDNGAHLIRADAETVTTITPEIQYSGEARMTGQMIRYPTDIEIGQIVRLGNPRVVDATLSHAQVVYDAPGTEGKPLKTWCEIARPARAWMGGGWIEKT